MTPLSVGDRIRVIGLAMMALLIAPGTAPAGEEPPTSRLVLEGILAVRDEERHASYYLSEVNEWPRPKVTIYPVLVLSDSGQRSTLLRTIVLDSLEGIEQTLELSIGGKPEPLPVPPPNAVTRELWGCQQATTVNTPVEIDLIRRIAEARQVKVSFAIGGRRQTYSLIDQDLKRFKQMVDLAGMTDLPPVQEWVDDVYQDGRLVGEFTEDIKNPKVIRKIQPQYPEQGWRHHREGRVILLARLLRDGKVGEIKVLRAAGGYCGFEESAMTAVKKWRYEPATKDDKPVEVYYTIIIDYFIRKSG